MGVTEYASRIADKQGEVSFLPEFHTAEKMVTREAIFNSMVSTCCSVELWPARAKIHPDDITYQDMSDPLDFIAQRLYNFVRWRREAGEEEPNKRRMFAASFVVEFGREHGLSPGKIDSTSENMFFNFLARVKEWGEHTRCHELAPCLDGLPPSLQQKAHAWWKANWKGVAVGTGILAAGLAVLGAVAYAAAQQR